MFSYENRVVSIRIDDYIIFVDDISRIKKFDNGIRIFYKSGGETIINDHSEQLFDDIIDKLGK